MPIAVTEALAAALDCLNPALIWASASTCNDAGEDGLAGGVLAVLALLVVLPSVERKDALAGLGGVATAAVVPPWTRMTELGSLMTENGSLLVVLPLLPVAPGRPAV